jgi:hypothetical protein
MTLLMLYDGYYFFVVNDIIGNSEHSSTSGQYGIGSPSAYGHVKIPAGNGLSVSNGIIAMAAASTSNPGAVQLSDSTDSSSTSLAATANAVRQVKALIASAGTGTSTVPTNHASTATTYGRATATLYGHAMASSATPLVAGTASAGTDNGKYAREGHVHPAQTVPGASSVIPGAPTTSGAIGTSVAFARADHTHPAQTTVTGNAGTATSLQTARSIGLSGQASGSVTFNGSANVSIPVTVYRGGEGALNNNSGTGNSAWGTYALYNVTGSYNTAVGSCALQGASTVSGNYNTGVGYYALIRNAGGSSNTGVGCQALYGTTTGSANTALGADALYGNSTGTENTALGQGAMYYGYSVSANTAVGTAALRRLTSGSLNVAIGTYAGSYYGGTEANLTSSNNSTYVGHNTRANSLSQQNQTVIGYGAIGNGSNSVTLGNSSVTKLCCQVTSITALSDTRIKEDIEPANLDLCLADVLRLPLHRYKYKAFTGKHLDQHVTGWLADDVALVFPKAVQTSDQYFSVLDADGNPVMETVTEEGPSGEDRTRQIEKMFLMEAVKDITMTEALPTLWGAVQKLANIVEAQAQRIAQLEGGVA